MRNSFALAAAAACALATASVQASPCSDQIDALEGQLKQGAEASISTSSAGQGVAGAREGQAIQGIEQNAPTGEPAVPFQQDKREVEATRRAADAGAGGDLVMQARVSLNRARSLDARGDGSACMKAVAEARGKLEERP